MRGERRGRGGEEESGEGRGGEERRDGEERREGKERREGEGRRGEQRRGEVAKALQRAAALRKGTGDCVRARSQQSLWQPLRESVLERDPSDHGPAKVEEAAASERKV